MKQSRTIISAIIVVAVLLTALGGISCSKKNEEKSGPAESEVAVEPEKTSEVQKPGDANELERERARMARTRPEARPTLGREDPARLRDVSPEERARLKEQKVKIQQSWENMSEEEKEEFRATMREIRQRGENMTEEEREKFKAELRERLNAGRQGND